MPRSFHLKLLPGGRPDRRGRTLLPFGPLMNDATDKQLVEDMARGDQAAVAELYDRYSGLLLGVARKLQPGRTDLEDLVHDVFLEAWRNAAKYDGDRASVRTWLLVRLRSRSLDRLRSAAEARRVDAPDGPPEPPPESPRMTAKLDAARVDAALQDLPEAHRAVLELAYRRGLSSSEIAEKLGVPIGTVKSRTKVALDRLRTRFADVREGAA